MPPLESEKPKPRAHDAHPAEESAHSPARKDGDLVAALAARQNPDGGWPHGKGGSCTEPSVLATLALLATGRTEAASRGIEWLGGVERADGGWAPQKNVEDSTWVTALVALLPPERLGAARHRKAIAWLLRMTGRESSLLYRLRQRMLGYHTPPEQRHHGWPWFPGAAAWVGPTSIGMLALRREQSRTPSETVARRLEEARLYLFSRTCRDGGWNHGSARALGQDGLPYPETTGMALAALGGTSSPEIARSLAAAERFLRTERSADGQNWLKLGLTAHGRALPSAIPDPAPYRTVRDQALGVLTEEALAGRNWLLPS